MKNDDTFSDDEAGSGKDDIPTEIRGRILSEFPPMAVRVVVGAAGRFVDQRRRVIKDKKLIDTIKLAWAGDERSTRN